MNWKPEIPPWDVTFWLCPLLAALIASAGYLCGWLKIRRRWRTGDTRKIFHFTIFTAAGVLSARFGMAAVNLLGGLMLIYILAILRWGEGNLFYEGLAREVDRPRRSLYIVLPFAATALGGIASSALFGPLAVVGFVVGGWGDAVGEPVGIRFGKHRYRVPNFGSGVSSHRSLEGSAAVFIASLTGAFLAMTVAGLQPARARETLFLAAACVAAAATAVEAISHHGLDNLTIQLVASGVAHAFLV